MTKTVSFLSDKAPPRKKIELTFDQKREICLFYVENSKCGNKVKQKDLIVKFNQKFKLVMGTSTMPFGTKRLRAAENPGLEDALWMWLSNKVSNGLAISLMAKPFETLTEMIENETIDFENFINYENDVPTGEVLSDEDIVSIVRNESKDDEDIVYRRNS
ncbi:hypothetical protein BpHYR1_046891 [Brachionus plicatilis]|uniref:Tigger transposable element-derived 6-like n=1 Tax=Brachionus plicatilis TaxID=10195 RepID=A0A3M7PWN9_BRAPC|nr:hypothetical protein BpHYR1_046891 [Brachionus plicatilis]